jgi:SAM-dependent methyltransferase
MAPSPIEQTRAAFDSNLPAWREYTESVRGRLRHAIILHNLRRHLRKEGDVLDVGGGTGEMAAALAREGYRVTVLDFSAAMLEQAKERCDEVASQVAFVHADASQAGALFGPEQFDAVLCHSLLEFASDPADLIRQSSRVLRRGGLLSVVAGNRYHAAMRAALVQHDLHRARAALDEEPAARDLFGLPLRTFYPETLRQLIEDSGLRVTGEYGVRVFADLAQGAQESWDEMLALELAASARMPYRDVARFVQLIAEKR